MKLFKQIIEKELEIFEFYELRKHYARAIWKSYQAFCIAVAVLGVEMNKKDIRIRNRMYHKLILKGNVNEREFEKLKKFMSNDFEMIKKSVEKIDNFNENMSFAFGQYHHPGIVAIDIDEFPIEG